MILNNQTRPTRSYPFDNADNAILLSPRKRPCISKSYAESHLSLLEDTKRLLSVYHVETEIILTQMRLKC